MNIFSIIKSFLMILLPGEQILISQGSSFTLTNLRSIKRYESWGNQFQSHFFLRDACSVEYLSTSKVVLLIIAVIFFLMGIFASSATRGLVEAENALILVLPALVFFVAWLLSKKKAIRITSTSGKHQDIPISVSASVDTDSLITHILEAIDNQKVKGVTPAS